MRKQRRVRKQRKTLLVVGEGHTEVAFLNYLKALYCRELSSASVKVENAQGKGPENVLNTAISRQKRASYDRVVAVLDTDIEWTAALKKDAKKHGVLLVGNKPCIEALFLALLGHKSFSETARCKEALVGVISADLLNKDSYASWCTKEMLECLRRVNVGLNALLKLYEGSW
ncbi:RloB domain-containing protein [Marinospirillum insulare]|uniref:RloB-like protein n=1 Tax=Marinospirillum insulare TaxID=217169 RepID=A0ABQ5ZZF0_9GAMM|nr:RloB domain-containing protein [Marinospirillum insulare]GLR64377.1 hypothetical protein GCM10007878_18150 [Marinospirillum insulare]